MDHVEVTSLEQWRAWLDQHHDQSPGAWLVSFRKGRGPYVGPYEANNEALRYGWFHAHRLRVDDLRIRHLYRPRRRYLPWSPSDRIETVKQIEAGYIHAAGLRRAREAQEDGSWDIGDEIRTGSIPLDLMEALDWRPDTRARFDLIDPAAKNQLLQQLSLDTGQRRGRRAELIEQLMNTVDRIDPLAPWWVPKKQFADDWVALAISGRLIGMFENAHEVNGALALTGPPGLGKSRSAAEFLRRNPKVAASVYLTPGSERSWSKMRRSLTKAARALGAVRPHVGDAVSGKDAAHALASAVRAKRSSSGGAFRGEQAGMEGPTFVIDDAQRLTDRILRKVLALNDMIRPERAGVILLGTPDLAERLDAIRQSLPAHACSVALHRLTAADLTPDDMLRFLQARGVDDPSVQLAVVHRLKREGAWSLRAIDRLIREG